MPAKKLYNQNLNLINLNDVSRQTGETIKQLTIKTLRSNGLIKSLTRFTGMDDDLIFNEITSKSREELVVIVGSLPAEWWKTLINIGNPALTIRIVGWIQQTYPAVFIENIVARYPDLLRFM